VSSESNRPDRRRRRAAAAWLLTITALAVTIGGLWFGHAPPRTEGAYRAEAVRTAQLLHSQVATAVLWVRQVDRDHVTHQAAVVSFEESESDATTTANRFAGWDPPSGTDRLRARVQRLAAAATEVLGRLRIAAHRGRWHELSTIARDAGRTADRLDRLARQVA
jgi:hypothetical protein